MKLFNKKPKIQEFRFIRITKFTVDGAETSYHSEINGLYVSGSVSFNKYEAEEFFNKLLENNGKTKIIEVLKSTLQ